MTQILLALGQRVNPLLKGSLILLFGLTMTAILWIGFLVPCCMHFDLLEFHGLCWLAWFYWQAYLFPASRDRLLKNRPDNAYRCAFYRDILPGVSFGVAQMLRPMFRGLTTNASITPSLSVILCALFCLLSGLFLLHAGFHTIGFASAGFLFEYSLDKPTLQYRGIYAIIRHPLFVGGALASLGTALLFADATTIKLGLLNLVILPIYCFCEDRRCIHIVGLHYHHYRSSVGGYLPKLTWFHNRLLGRKADISTLDATED